MNERKLNDFTPQPPPAGNRTSWRAFPITVDFQIDSDWQPPEEKNQENANQEAS